MTAAPLKFMTPKLQRALADFAGMRPDSEPAPETARRGARRQGACTGKSQRSRQSEPTVRIALRCAQARSSPPLDPLHRSAHATGASHAGAAPRAPHHAARTRLRAASPRTAPHPRARRLGSVTRSTSPAAGSLSNSRWRIPGACRPRPPAAPAAPAAEPIDGTAESAPHRPSRRKSIACTQRCAAARLRCMCNAWCP